MLNNVDIERCRKIFFPYALQKYYESIEGNQRFVYYTRAETAMNIIREKKVWMRNATCMNDYMEITYGINCLQYAYNSPSGQKFAQSLDRIFTGISEEIKTLFERWLDHLRIDTYLTCISEHLDQEDTLGRLSMWRAYGKDSGIAIVLNNTPFLTPSDALKAYTNPVAYFSKEETEEELKEITNNIIRECDFLRVQDRNIIINFVFNVFKFAALCIKHPGFKEEREWRIVYTPRIATSQHIEKDIRVINGIPQQLYKIPLIEIPEAGFFGATIPQIIDRIIIGPTEFPLATYRAFVEILAEAGVADPDKKVVVSDIPLRRG